MPRIYRTKWKPRAKTQRILTNAYEHIKSVPYGVSPRWVFYRLLQDGIYTSKTDWDHFLPLQAKARKNCFEDWRPWTLVDSVRQVFFYAGGYKSVSDYQQNLPEILQDSVDVRLDHFYQQDHYVEIWFEAQAMTPQFQYYTKRINLRPFRGDYSIEKKWRAVVELERYAKAYKKPIVILYFGDCDTKGEEIPENAMKDVHNWCELDIQLHVGGLTVEQAKDFNLPTKIGADNKYQWEALSDEQAGQIITDSVSQYINLDYITELESIEQKATEEIKQEVSSRFGGF